MLLSMTGFGKAQSEQDGLAVAVDVRASSSRFFQLTIRATDGYASLEPRIEAIVRQCIRACAVQVNLRVDRLRSHQSFRINSDVLNGCRNQLQSLDRKWNLNAAFSLEALLSMPGIVNDQSALVVSAETVWPAVSAVLKAAMQNLARTRTLGGTIMADDLSSNCRNIASCVEGIRRQAPLVLDAHRKTLIERVCKVLSKYGVSIDHADIIRAVSVHADRGDLSEEIARLKSYLGQFDSIMRLRESSGRKLEFLTQELLREANAIGSIVSDVGIVKCVIEIKTAIEQIREIIQNIE